MPTWWNAYTRVSKTRAEYSRRAGASPVVGTTYNFPLDNHPDRDIIGCQGRARHTNMSTKFMGINRNGSNLYETTCDRCSYRWQESSYQYNEDSSRYAHATICLEDSTSGRKNYWTLCGSCEEAIKGFLNANLEI